MDEILASHTALTNSGQASLSLNKWLTSEKPCFIREWGILERLAMAVLTRVMAMVNMLINITRRGSVTANPTPDEPGDRPDSLPRAVS